MTTIFNCCNLSVFNYLVMIMTAKQLDQIDVKAIKTCDSIYFITDKHDYEIDTAKIVLIKKINDDPWRNESRHEIECKATIAGCRNATCTQSISNYQDSVFNVWATIANFVKKGDELELFWYSDHYVCGELALKDVEYDRLYLIVWRGDKQFTFFVNQTNCIKGDSYRTIRKLGEATTNVYA